MNALQLLFDSGSNHSLSCPKCKQKSHCTLADKSKAGYYHLPFLIIGGLFIYKFQLGFVEFIAWYLVTFLIAIELSFRRKNFSLKKY